jgi:hypothetical protein
VDVLGAPAIGARERVGLDGDWAQRERIRIQG